MTTTVTPSRFSAVSMRDRKWMEEISRQVASLAAASPKVYANLTGTDGSTATCTTTAERITFASTNGVTALVVDTAGNDTVTLATPQDVRASASPTFANITDSGLTVKRIVFAGTAGLLDDSAALTFTDSLPGGSAEVGLSVSKTLSRSIDLNTSLALIQSSLTTTDAFASGGNDGTTTFYAAQYTYVTGGTINTGGDVVSLNYCGFSGSVNNTGVFTMEGSADLSVNVTGVEGFVSLGNVSIPTTGGDLNLTIIGGNFSAQAQVTVVAPSVPILTYYGIKAIAQRGGGANPDACYGAHLRALSGTLNYGAYVEGTTAGVYSKGHFVPFTNNTYDVGTSSLRVRKVWSVDADFSGAVGVAGTLTTSAGRKVKRTAVADAGYTILSTDEIVAYTSLTTGRTATLPNATGNSGQVFTIKDETGSCSLYNITIATGGGNIDGAATFVMNIPYQSISVYSNGTNYFIV